MEKTKDKHVSAFSLKGLLKSKIAENVVNAVTDTVHQTIQRNVMSNEDLAFGSNEKLSTTKIPIELIHPCPDQPRQVFDPQALEELAQTMDEIGQAQAITVRKTEHAFEIISGERRFRAAKLAGFTHLDCLIKECSRKEARLLALVENTQRQDLLPLEESLFLSKVLSENESLSLDKLAKHLGTHKSTLSEKIQLKEVPDGLKPMMYTSKGKYFTHRHWRVVSRIENDEFLENIFKRAVEQQMSVAELERSLQAAGIKKSRRKKKAAMDLSEAQLKIKGTGLMKRDGRIVKFKNLTMDIDNLSPAFKNQMRKELEWLKEELDK